LQQRQDPKHLLVILLDQHHQDQELEELQLEAPLVEPHEHHPLAGPHEHQAVEDPLAGPHEPLPVAELAELHELLVDALLMQLEVPQNAHQPPVYQQHGRLGVFCNALRPLSYQLRELHASVLLNLYSAENQENF
jgi:hypothetical protein